MILASYNEERSVEELHLKLVVELKSPNVFDLPLNGDCFVI